MTKSGQKTTQAPSATPARPASRSLPYMKLPHAQRGAKAAAAEAPPRSHPVGAEIRCTHLMFKSALQQRLRAHNITSAQWAFLRILWNEDGINQKDLAGRLNIHPTTAVPALTIMERNGLVRRERNGQDKRNVYIYLTEAGQQLSFELVPYAAEMNERSLQGLTDAEADTLMSLLWKVQQNLRSALSAEGIANDATDPE